MKILIIGGGISGLVAAINFAKRGIEICVLEKSSNLQKFGALQISPNGCRILEKIGVLPMLKNSYFLPNEIEMKNGKSGKIIFSMEIKNTSQKRWGAPYIQIERNALIMALQKRLQELQQGAIKLNCKVICYEKRRNKISAILENGDKITGDILIGADGINSVIKKQIYLGIKNKDSGYIAWRAQVEVNKLNNVSNNTCIWLGKQSHVVTSRIKGGEVLNFVAIGKENGRKTIDEFKNWHSTIKNIIENASDIFHWKIFTTPNLQPSPEKNIVLIGDAAHAMLPSMAQGGVMAIEDGFILSEMIYQNKTIAEFENVRAKRIKMVKSMSANNFNLFHYGNFIYLPLSIVGKIAPNILYARLDKLYGYHWQ